ncbi:MAG: efflux RND transporter periplasmic adaptor subunit [Chlamydiales bacterium]
MRQFLSMSVLSVILFLCACSKEKERKAPEIPVLAAKVERQDIPITIECLGHLTPMKTVRIQAKISGELIEAPFKEGEKVSKGDLLFRIEPDIYQARVLRAQANLHKAKADLAFAKKKIERYRILSEKQYVAEMSIDELENVIADNEAIVAAAEADLEVAEIELKDCTICSPIDGLLGERKIGVYNHVSPGALLTTIVKTEKVDVSFHVNEKDIPALQQALKENKHLPLTVKTQFNQQATGHLNFVDHSLDPLNGTLLLKGTVDNQAYSLEPGQYVIVSLELRVDHNATIVPDAAIQIGQQGTYLYTISDDGKASLIQVNPVYRKNGNVVIAENLPKGTQVVIDGHINLYPDAKVLIKGDNISS